MDSDEISSRIKELKHLIYVEDEKRKRAKVNKTGDPNEIPRGIK